MEKQEIKERLTEIVRKIFNDNSLILSEDMSATTVDAWTSLTFMQLLTEIEEQFKFKFKMMELIQLKNIGDIIKSIESHTN